MDTNKDGQWQADELRSEAVAPNVLVQRVGEILKPPALSDDAGWYAISMLVTQAMALDIKSGSRSVLLQVGDHEFVIQVGKNAMIDPMKVHYFDKKKISGIRADISLGKGSCIDEQPPVIATTIPAKIAAGTKIQIAVSALDECAIDPSSLKLSVTGPATNVDAVYQETALVMNIPYL